MARTFLLMRAATLSVIRVSIPIVVGVMEKSVSLSCWGLSSSVVSVIAWAESWARETSFQVFPTPSPRVTLSTSWGITPSFSLTSRALAIMVGRLSAKAAVVVFPEAISSLPYFRFARISLTFFWSTSSPRAYLERMSSSELLPPGGIWASTESNPISWRSLWFSAFRSALSLSMAS